MVPHEFSPVSSRVQVHVGIHQVLDVMKPILHKRKIEYELEGFGCAQPVATRPTPFPGRKITSFTALYGVQQADSMVKLFVSRNLVPASCHSVGQ